MSHGSVATNFDEFAEPADRASLASNFQHQLSSALVRVVERGDTESADQAAVAAMRTAFEGLPIAGTIVIGEGERDQAPMLYIGEPRLRERVEQMGICDPRRIYSAEELAPGEHLIFAACGVTTGALLTGVRFFGGRHRTHSVVMTLQPNEVRFIDSIHMTQDPGPRGVRRY